MSALLARLPLWSVGSDALRKITLGMYVALLVGLLVSKFLLSVSTICVVLLAIGTADAKRVKLLWHHKVWWSYPLVFGLVLLSWANSDNTLAWLDIARIKLPCLFLPIAFGLLPPIRRTDLFWVLSVFSVLMVLSSVGVLGYYALHFEVINEAIRKSGAIPTPIHHIRFSLLVAFGSIVSFELGVVRFYNRWFWIGCSLFLALCVHVLAVRSGLLAFYLAVFILLVQYMVLGKHWKVGLVSLWLLLAMPFAAWRWIPSIQHKISLTHWNWRMYQQGNIASYSDTERWVSYEMGIRIGRDHPVLGVGYGDLSQTISAYYEQYWHTLTPKMPHNQFIEFFAAVGWVGLLGFLVAVFYPLRYGYLVKNRLWLAAFIIVVFSFLVESTLETQVGVAFCTFFGLLLVSYEVGNRTPTT